MMKKKDDALIAQNIIDFKNWKNKNKLYLRELQKFFDLADNIKDKALKESIIYQMLKCDEILTNMIEEVYKSINKNK